MLVVFDIVFVRIKFVFNCLKDEFVYDRKYKKWFWMLCFFFLYLYKIFLLGVGLKFKNGKIVYDYVVFCNFFFFWWIYVVGKENEKSFLFRMEESLVEENDNGFDDREVRLESYDKGNREFDDVEFENIDDDLYFF